MSLLSSDRTSAVRWNNGVHSISTDVTWHQSSSLGGIKETLGHFLFPKSSKSDVTASQWAPKLGYQAVGNEEILPRQYRIEMSMEGQRARSQTAPSLLVSGLKMAATTMKQIRHLTRCDPVSWEHFVVITQIIQRTEEPNTDYISLCHDLSRIFVTICLFLT